MRSNKTEKEKIMIPVCVDPSVMSYSVQAIAGKEVEEEVVRS